MRISKSIAISSRISIKYSNQMMNLNTSLPEPSLIKKSKNLAAKTERVNAFVKTKNSISLPSTKAVLPEILVLSSYPPKECGLATYSQDLIKALNNKFGNSFDIHVCALESSDVSLKYPKEVTCTLDTSDSDAYFNLARKINASETIKSILIQHEFGLFGKDNGSDLLKFMNFLYKPIILVFHTVLPKADFTMKVNVKSLIASCESVIVMTQNAAEILIKEYDAPADKVTVIAHGTHLVPHISKVILKEKYGFIGKKVLSTFGLLSSGKGIETTIEALSTIVKAHPETLFLVIGKTHPTVVKSEGEIYRNKLEERVLALGLQKNVKFINTYLSLPILLEYLQMTDVYIFSSKDPNQAVSGTFAYAMSCACPIISTPIPPALEALSSDTGLIVDFQNSKQMAKATIDLLNDEELRIKIGLNTLQKSICTAWENSAVAHANLLEKLVDMDIMLSYSFPDINLNHFENMTTPFGMLQFSKINQPDIDSGYTLDDNARALIAMCMHFEATKDENDIPKIRLYVDFIEFCLQSSGYFLNYVDEDKTFTPQNEACNLADSNGRAIWALGYLVSISELVPEDIVTKVELILEKVMPHFKMLHSTRAMAFTIKGLYYSFTKTNSELQRSVIKMFADRLVAMYNHEAEKDWKWYEGYLTYGNSILPEAMLLAWLVTKDPIYKSIAKDSFDFLLENTFSNDGIQVISNRTWWRKGHTPARFGEQPIEITYTILALAQFYEVFKDPEYLQKMTIAFDWFLGKNHLSQVIYNPCTGGCYDGLEETQVNLNQGAESTVCYLIARLKMEEFKNKYHSITTNKSHTILT
jgi:glycosyltransferase involved in cell wall biosynthesis